MANPLKRLLGAGTTAADIAAALERAQLDLVSAAAAVGTAAQNYDESLLTETPTALRKLSDARQDAAIEVDRCRAVIAKLEGQLEKAQAAEAEDGRRQAYEKAKAASDAARKKLQREYPQAAQTIRSLLGDIAAAAMAVAEANENLPEGAARLEGPEDFRSTPNTYREDLSQEVIDMWCDRSGTPVPDELQRKVRPEEKPRRDDNMLHGQVQVESGDWLQVQRRRLLRRKFLPNQNGRFLAPLAHELTLPPLDGYDAFWVPTNYTPDRVLAEIAKPLRGRPQAPERVPEFEYANPPRETVDE